jgi:hypothetical protein
MRDSIVSWRGRRSRVQWFQNKRLPLQTPLLKTQPTPKEDNPLFVSLPPLPKEKEKGNLATERWAREVGTQILYTIHDLPTNHGIPPTGAMQFVSKGGKKKPKKGKKKAVRA